MGLSLEQESEVPVSCLYQLGYQGMEPWSGFEPELWLCGMNLILTLSLSLCSPSRRLGICEDLAAEQPVQYGGAGELGDRGHVRLLPSLLHRLVKCCHATLQNPHIDLPHGT